MVRHYDMPKYDMPSKHFAGFAEEQLDAETVESMWQLFIAICVRWQNVAEPLTMKTRFLGFLSNRIELHPEYVSHYRTAAAVITELREVHGEGAYEFLFTNPEANSTPPQTPRQITRQLVSNEFIALQLSLGGFKVGVNVAYDQTVYGLPIWDAGVNVRIDGKATGVTGSYNAAHHRVQTHRPAASAAFLPHLMDLNKVIGVLGLSLGTPGLTINGTRAFWRLCRT